LNQQTLLFIQLIFDIIFVGEFGSATYGPGLHFLRTLLRAAVVLCGPSAWIYG